MTKTEEYHLKRGHEPIGSKSCIECGTVFNIFNKHEIERKKFCSTKCQYADLGRKNGKRQLGSVSPLKGRQRKPRETRKCEQCGKPFEVILTNKADNARRFCSLSCSYNAVIRGKFIGEESPRWSERVTIKCAACGKDFQDYAARKKRMKTCSKECANKLLERPAIHVCQNCGKKTQTTEYHAKTQKYCSRACLFEAMPTTNTSIELKIKELLKIFPNVQRNYPFEKFSVDFAIPDLKIFIECDGTYWHSLPGAIIRDATKDRLAAEQGWLMLRLPEKEINEDLAGCDIKIKQAIASRTTKSLVSI
jgi:very-short-patch-repair endonuclease